MRHKNSVKIRVNAASFCFQFLKTAIAQTQQNKRLAVRFEMREKRKSIRKEEFFQRLSDRCALERPQNFLPVIPAGGKNGRVPFIAVRKKTVRTVARLAIGVPEFFFR